MRSRLETDDVGAFTYSSNIRYEREREMHTSNSLVQGIAHTWVAFASLVCLSSSTDLLAPVTVNSHQLTPSQLPSSEISRNGSVHPKRKTTTPELSAAGKCILVKRYQVNLPYAERKADNTNIDASNTHPLPTGSS
jgi:hypothetical protein